ncbi:globin [Chromatiales bacterium (ex Bugula neritina AB1)]|nr:globin [Chromatiales bacterium (ex Bugula neritina AB1)]
MNEPQPPVSQYSPYQLIGGETAVRQLVDRFYDLMDERDDARVIRAMHPARLDHSRLKLFEFLSGFFGGPALYHQNRGHPKLRMRHFPFQIDTAARDSWLQCMYQALDEQIEDQLLLTQLKTSFYKTADHMINKDEQP